jgi:hypothetical protein
MKNWFRTTVFRSLQGLRVEKQGFLNRQDVKEEKAEADLGTCLCRIVYFSG